MDALFTAAGLSLAEVEAGKTEGTALAVAVTTAKGAAKIKHSDKMNKLCISELKLVTSNGVVPQVEAAPTGAAANPF